MKNKIPYNCVKDHKGYIIPKSVSIKNSPEIIEWLSTFDGVRFMFNDVPNTLNLDSELLTIGIGHSNAGHIYCYVSPTSKEWAEQYEFDNPNMKIFNDDYESFKKYLTWVGKLGPWFTKQLFKKNNE